MTYMQITYRTKTDDRRGYAVVPGLYADAFVTWLLDSHELADVDVTRFDKLVFSGQTPFMADKSWPEYDACKRYIGTSNIVFDPYH